MTNTEAPAAAREFAVTIDTQAAATDGEYAALLAQLDRLTDQAHRDAGDKQARAYRNGPLVWGMQRDEAIDAATADTRAAIAALQTQIDANRDRAAALDQVWRTHGHWSRYFLVTSSDGHIHRDTVCSQRGFTQYGWQPELSGVDTADAVAALGPRLCTKCFAEAPVEWTVGALPETACTGSKKAPAGPRVRVGRQYIAECGGCGQDVPVNGDGTVRQHDKPLTAEQAAAKDARRKAQAKVTKAENDARYWGRIVERAPSRIATTEEYLSTAQGDDYAAHLQAELARDRAELERAQGQLTLAEGRLAKAQAALAALLTD